MPSQDLARSQQATIAALTRSSREPSGAAMTDGARSKFLARFYNDTDPALPEAERQRQARAALSAQMRKTALARTDKKNITTKEAKQIIADAREQLVADLAPLLAEVVREVLAETLRPRADAV